MLDFIFTTFLEVYQLLAYAKNEQFSETIPTTEGNITLNLDAHEIAVLKFSMTITHCDHFTLDRFTVQNYRIDYKIKIDNSGNEIHLKLIVSNNVNVDFKSQKRSIRFGHI